jgi:hypothetical protein
MGRSEYENAHLRRVYVLEVLLTLLLFSCIWIFGERKSITSGVRAFGARASWSMTFEAPKIRIQIFQENLKKNHGVDNVVFYRCVIF